MEKAREEKERIRMLTERGITSSEIGQSHQPSATNSTGKKMTRA